MAHLWSRENGAWQANELLEAAYVLEWLDGTPEPRVVEGAGGGGNATDAFLIRDRAAPGEWVLVSSGGDLWVNGTPLSSKLRVLRDRDEISWSGRRRVYFSTERRACVAPLPAEETDIVCPRCRDVIPIAGAAMQCPGCGIWYHQSGDFPCYTLGPECVSCGHPTDLDSEFRWSPADV